MSGMCRVQEGIQVTEIPGRRTVTNENYRFSSCAQYASKPVEHSNFEINKERNVEAV